MRGGRGSMHSSSRASTMSFARSVPAFSLAADAKCESDSCAANSAVGLHAGARRQRHEHALSSGNPPPAAVRAWGAWSLPPIDASLGKPPQGIRPGTGRILDPAQRAVARPLQNGRRASREPISTKEGPMNISSICTRRLVAVDGGSTLFQAAAMMREQHVGALVITHSVGAGACVTGIVTDRDLVIDVLAQGLDPAGMKVGELASETIVSVSESADLADAMAVMEAHGVRRVLVTDAQERVVGVVALDDLMDACAEEIAGLSKVIRSGLQREASQVDDTPPMPLRVPSVGTAGWNTVVG
ncbi:CBS domain-containing protein [Variovorax beijingensis]|uniref:CBS domain-containing protein n=2 Tax=Variovorax beijingensis TaxID=2496117 RepID=A0ABY0A1K8_9BURK|nr:CBS domain-containing protein [Variovorax beijingensis]